jgi:Hypothetical glycosyl hydrolase 6
VSSLAAVVVRVLHAIRRVVTPPGAASARAPAWFEENRVQGHTRLTLRLWLGTQEFAQAAVGFKGLGAGAFTRHVKSADEDPWWPPGAPIGPDGHPVSDRNAAEEIIDEAHTEGSRIVAYYWHMTEARLAGLHPEWVCREPDGVTAIDGRRGDRLDITGPYREVVLTRLLELAEMGADGLFFDSEHLPPDGCWGSALEDAWKAETGEDAPTPPDTNPRYLDFIEFKARKIEETFIYWRDKVKAKHPDLVFIVGTTSVPALTDHAMTTRLVRIADSPKNEYLLAVQPRLNKHVFENGSLAVPPAHVRQAVGWTVLRDSADGRPPHIWTPGLPNDEHAQAFAGSLLTFGCVANMDVADGSVLGNESPGDGKTPLDALRAAFALGQAASPHLARTQPLRWAAVHFGERSRNAREGDYHRAWREVLWPLVGAFQVLSEDGLPVGIVNDHQLEHGELHGYRLLVLPDTTLTPVQQQKVAAFRAAGGVVIANEPAWRWSDPDGTDAAAAAFRAALSQHIATAPVRVTGGPTGRYAVAYRGGGRMVTAVTNNFAWVQAKDWAGKPINPAAPCAEGVQVTWQKGHGLPQTPGRGPRPHRLRAFDAITGKPVDVERVDGGYRASLPRFRFMALLVVTRRSRRGGGVGGGA